MNPTQALADFKLDSEQHDLLPIFADKSMLMLVWAWTKVRVQWEPPEMVDDAPTDNHDLWDTLWQYSSWRIEDISFLVTKSNVFTAKLFEKARRFRIIYPDGTISEGARESIVRYMERVSEDSFGPSRKKESRGYDN